MPRRKAWDRTDQAKQRVILQIEDTCTCDRYPPEDERELTNWPPPQERAGIAFITLMTFVGRAC